MNKVVFFLSAFLLVMYAVYRGVQGELYDMHCGDYIQRASIANTVPLAEENLKIAISYAKEHKLTEGYTSVLYNTPDEDIGFFYRNLVDSEKSLEALPPDAPELTVSNALLKLHNSLVVQGKESSSVIQPSGISVYPQNVVLAIVGWILVVICGVSSLWLMDK